MIRIAIGGAIDKQKIFKIIKECGYANIETKIMTDIEAAMAVKRGDYEYYLGACSTGGGGALAMAIAIIGASKCVSVSMPGKGPKEENIKKAISEGKIAFGFTNEHIDKAVPLILKNIVEIKN